MFREPFEADDSVVDLSAYPLRNASAATVTVTTKQTAATLEIPGGNTLVMVGGCSPGEAKAAAELAQRLQVPLLGDVTSGLRTHAYDLALLRDCRCPRRSYTSAAALFRRIG